MESEIAAVNAFVVIVSYAFEEPVRERRRREC